MSSGSEPTAGGPLAEAPLTGPAALALILFQPIVRDALPSEAHLPPYHPGCAGESRSHNPGEHVRAGRASRGLGLDIDPRCSVAASEPEVIHPSTYSLRSFTPPPRAGWRLGPRLPITTTVFQDSFVDFTSQWHH